MPSAMVTCVQENPTPSSQKYTLSEHPIRSTLMPKPPEFGNTLEDRSKNFPPGTTFVPHRLSVKSGLDFVNVLCTQSETYLPILMENNKNHQITLNKGVIGYSSLDISDRERPKYQIRDCVKMVNSILMENDQ